MNTASLWRLAVTLLCCAWLCAGCGNKGILYLPADTAAAPAESSDDSDETDDGR